MCYRRQRITKEQKNAEIISHPSLQPFRSCTTYFINHITAALTMEYLIEDVTHTPNCSIFLQKATV